MKIMSKYTTEVRYICEYYAGQSESGDYSDIDDIIAASSDTVIGNYPIFDETYRDTLNAKILKHYYTREICEETAGLWRLRLNARMNEIMPYYNKLYESELLKFNPLYDVNLNTTRVRNENQNENNNQTSNDTRSENKAFTNDSERVGEEVSNGQSTSSSSSASETSGNSTSAGNTANSSTTKSTSSGTSADSKSTVDKYSDTPQGAITNLESDTYLTNARIIDNSDSNTQQSAQNGEASGASNYSESNQNKGSSSESESGQATTYGKVTNNDKTSNVSTEQISENRAEEKTGNRDIATTEDYLEHVYGKNSNRVTYSKMLQEFRETFLNIDMMIISNLSDLFFGLWD